MTIIDQEIDRSGESNTLLSSHTHYLMSHKDSAVFRLKNSDDENKKHCLPNVLISRERNMAKLSCIS